LAFDSPRRVKSTASSGLDATPDSLRLSQRPPASIRHQVPLYIHRSAPLPGLLSDRAGSAELSPAFTGSRSVVFILAETRPLIEATRHHFRSLRPVSPDHVLGLHATPIPPGGKVPPGRLQPAPGSYCGIQRLLVGPFVLSAADFPRGECSIPVARSLLRCLQAFPSRGSGPRRPGEELWLLTGADC